MGVGNTPESSLQSFNDQDALPFKKRVKTQNKTLTENNSRYYIMDHNKSIHSPYDSGENGCGLADTTKIKTSNNKRTDYHV